MTKTIFILFFLFFLCESLLAQTKELPEDSLIQKYKIKSITEWLCDSDTLSNNYEVAIYSYNSIGKLSSMQWIPDKEDTLKGDTTFSGTIYFYKNDNLIKLLNIGIWDTETMKTDTVEIEYTYDNLNNLIEERIICLNRKWDYAIRRNYDSQKRNIQIIYENVPHCSFQGIDSLFYQDNNLILKINHVTNTRILYKYNNDSSLYLISNGQLNDTTKIHHLNYFYFSHKLLISEKELHSVNGKNNYSERTYKYYYDSKGLLLKIERYFKDKVVNFTELKYEYY